ncbi:MAG: DinB family protein [Planctomycetota bacterium]
MDSIDLIRGNLCSSELIVLSRIEDMRDHCMVRSSVAGGSHTLWILGHLAFIEGLVVCEFMRGESNPLEDWKRMFDESTVNDDINQMVPFDRALSQCRRMRASTISLIDSLDESDLDRKSARAPETAKAIFGDFRGCLQYCSDHWLMHRGQLANARTAAGLTPMWF